MISKTRTRRAAEVSRIKDCYAIGSKKKVCLSEMQRNFTASQLFSRLLTSCHLFSTTLISVHLVKALLNSLFISLPSSQLDPFGPFNLRSSHYQGTITSVQLSITLSHLLLSFYFSILQDHCFPSLHPCFIQTAFPIVSAFNICTPSCILQASCTFVQTYLTVVPTLNHAAAAAFFPAPSRLLARAVDGTCQLHALCMSVAQATQPCSSESLCQSSKLSVLHSSLRSVSGNRASASMFGKNWSMRSSSRRRGHNKGFVFCNSVSADRSEMAASRFFKSYLFLSHLLRF